MHRLNTQRSTSGKTWRLCLAIAFAFIVTTGTAHYAHADLAATATPIAIPTATATTTATPITASTFTVPEFGIVLTLPTGLIPSDLEYSADMDMPVSASDEHPWSTVSFTTKSLLQLDSNCTADQGPIGMIIRYTEDPTTIHAEVTESFPLGSYYFAYFHPQDTCSANLQADQLETQQIALLQQALETAKLSNQ